jgi:hypothetical protein
MQGRALALDDDGAGQLNGMPIHFEAEKPGFITLVAEDKDGNRVKNLVFDHPVKAGDNVIYWDGSSMTGIAAPGTYRVRGIFHEGITPHLEYSIYSPGRPPWPTADGTGAWLATIQRRLPPCFFQKVVLGRSKTPNRLSFSVPIRLRRETP